MQVSSFIDEIPSLEEILFAGVVVKLVEAAISCPEKQPALLQLLLTAFHTEAKPKCCVPLVMSLMAYEMYFKSESGVKTAKRYQLIVSIDHPMCKPDLLCPLNFATG